MYQKAVAALKLIAACAMMLGLMTTMSTSTVAQTVCRNAPALGAVDTNGDGIATTGEIRALAPDNAELQSVAGQLEAQGISGIQYSGCSEDGSGGGSGTGGGEGTDTTGGGSDDGSGTGGGTGAEGDASGSGTGTDNATTDNATGEEGASGTGGGSESATGGSSTGGGDGTGAGRTTVTSVPDTGTGSTANSGQPALVFAFGAVAVIAMLGALMVRSRRVT